MPFKAGNKLGRGRPPAGQAFSDALRIAVSERGPDGHKKLRKLADVLVERGLSGDIQAIREIADRLEGKAATNSDRDQQVQSIVVQFSASDEALM